MLSFAFQMAGEEGKEESKEKKFAVELSAGLGMVNPADLFLRASGIEAMVAQYVAFTEADSTVTGEFKKVKMLIPMNISATYALGKKLYLRAGVEYGTGLSSSEKGFLMSWPPVAGSSVGGTESQYYGLNYKVTYFMPQVGVGYRVGKTFDIYGSVGFGLARFSYTEDFTVLMNSVQTVSSSLDYTAKGTAPGFILGAKYRFPLRRWESESGAHGFIKVEYMMFKVNELKGTNRFGTGASVIEEFKDVTFYTFQFNPFELGSLDYWDAFLGEPGAPGMTNPKKMALNLSAIRLMIGISF